MVLPVAAAGSSAGSSGNGGGGLSSGGGAPWANLLPSGGGEGGGGAGHDTGGRGFGSSGNHFAGGQRGGGTPVPTHGAPHGGGGQGVDPRQVQALQAQIQQQQALFQQLQRQQQQVQPQLQLIDQLRQVFNPQQQQADPNAAYEQQLERYLQAALDDQRQGGSGFPLTLNLATEFYQHMMAYQGAMNEIKSALAELKEGLAQQRDPQRQNDQVVGRQIHSQLVQTIDRVYGPGSQNIAAKEGIYQAAQKQVQRIITTLRQQQPQVWGMLQHNPQELGRMVQDVVAGLMPPRVQQMLQQEHIRNTDLSLDELQQAFRQAHAEYKDNPEMLREVTDAIRQQILERTWGGGGGRRAG